MHRIFAERATTQDPDNILTATLEESQHKAR